MSVDIKAVVTDIEGTTSSLSFVKDVLFPYAYKHMPDYVWDHEKNIEDILDQVREEERNYDLNLEEIIEVLLRYMDEDRKITTLKTLQGLIWEEGYKSGELHGHIYEDAVKGLKRWKSMGIKLYIYSSGSVAAQKLLFANTPAGDLTPMFSGYFDTTTGGKKEPQSYEKITQEIGFSPNQILFLSDSTEEINAAAAAGLNVVVLDREEVLFDAQGHTVVHDFNDLLADTVDA